VGEYHRPFARPTDIDVISFDYAHDTYPRLPDYTTTIVHRPNDVDCAPHANNSRTRGLDGIEKIEPKTDLVFQMTGLMITAELAQGSLIQIPQNVLSISVSRVAGSKTLSVNFLQLGDQRVSVLTADLTDLSTLGLLMPISAVPTPAASSRADQLAQSLSGIWRRNRHLSVLCFDKRRRAVWRISTN
jgi:hypothetical protein